MSDVWHDGLTLRRWRLNNFKSAREADVELAPLTLIVGANSAGKSSFLQSIRGVVQALSVAGTAFPLNGDQVRLGTFEETLWSGELGNDNAKVQIGAQFHWQQGVGRVPSRVRDGRRVGGFRSRRREMALDWTISLAGQPTGQPALTWLQSVRVEASSDSPERYLLQAGVERNVGSDGTRTFGGVLQRDAGTQQQLSEVHVIGGFPVRAVGRRSLIPRLVDAWLDVARDAALESINRNQLRRGSRVTTDVATLATLIGEDINSLLNSYSDAELTSVAFERRERLEMRQLAMEREFVDFSLAAKDLAQLIKSVEKVVGRTLYANRSISLPDNIVEITQSVREFLGNRVQHLGPLRMDPQVVYTAAPLSGSGYIGDKGEYTAAVLQAKSQETVATPMPPGADGRVGNNLMVATLGSAVNAWAAYLGIGEAFSTTDQGRLGLRLEVRQPDVEMRLDLTSVGTGVSQLLPVLVMCLQAPPGSLLLIEQPELHLNPAVQQRLGDFLLAVTMSGRQLIVETHSDYLINRLRLHTVADRSETYSERIAIVFAERVRGETKYATTHPSPTGSLEEWPAGFFDESAKESERILRAMAERAHDRKP